MLEPEASAIGDGQAVGQQTDFKDTVSCESKTHKVRDNQNFLCIAVVYNIRYKKVSASKQSRIIILF